ncbi:MAG TPA: Crp/Fnr family transcriptional regulator [Synergistaceae bacterium]|nr:Crp/Fnr family transcriptional regulator [Synergistaceae bacterium]HPQ38102.1 Crp/Fnr family transcriptional regulator [Synergistaceae bacterium]
MKEKEKFLDAIPGFSGLPPEDLREIAALALSRKYEKGAMIFLEGERGEGFYVVQRGTLKVFKVSPEGKEIILHLCGPGDHLGHAAVFEGSTFPASAEALGKCLLYFFPREAIMELIAREPNIALHMLGVLSFKLRELTLQVENLALKEVPGRLASYLLHLREGGDAGENVLDLEISRTQLARVLGTTPETLSRILGDMTSRGLLEISRRHLVLRDLSALEYLAEQGKYPEKSL